MIRKTKIQSAVVVVVFGALVWAVWPEQDEGTVSVIYAGVSVNDSNVVLFTITNSSKTTFVCDRQAEGQDIDGWRDIAFTNWGSVGKITGRSAMNYRCTVPSTNRWRIQVLCLQDASEYFMLETRNTVGEFALNHHWSRVSEWVLPQTKFRYAYGPPMLGNQPWPP